LRLIRIAIGSFSDLSLTPGNWRKLDVDDRKRAELGSPL
jgi:hypothetical protein